MNLREKIGQLFMVGFDGTEPPPTLVDLIRNYFIGGVILFRRNIKSHKQLAELISELKKIAGDRRLLIGVDHEGGRVFRMPSPFTQFVPMGQIKSPATAYEIGKRMAIELKNVGIDINFAPVLDVDTNIKNPVIGDRSFSENPVVVAELGVQLIKGLQENGVVACGKHFPGHGDTSLDSHNDLPPLPHTLVRLESLELIPFRAAIDAGVKSIMTAHVVYEGLDKDAPATLSPIIIKGLLQDGLKFRGVVFTDDLQMGALAGRWPLPGACIRALQAGCDICLICRDNVAQKKAIEHVIQAVNAGEILEDVINTACRKVRTLF